MFDIYWNDDCVCGGFESEDSACNALVEIVKVHNLQFLAAGGDGPNSWGAYKAVDADGFPSYHILSIRKNNYKITIKSLDK